MGALTLVQKAHHIVTQKEIYRSIVAWKSIYAKIHLDTAMIARSIYGQDPPPQRPCEFSVA
jgi:hypothetical protein